MSERASRRGWSRLARTKTAAILHLEDHPNLAEILAILAQLPHVDDAELRRLAGGWRNTVSLADARRAALSPDSPLVVEVLAAFDALSALYADDLDGEADYIVVEPEVTSIALKAARDALAGAYARPALSRTEHDVLLRAWNGVFARPTVDEPDLGPSAREVKALLASLPLLSRRCHDPAADAAFEDLSVQVLVLDADRHQAAVDAAFAAAVRTGRRRVWTLVRRSGAQSFSRGCPSCRVSLPVEGVEARRVLNLCLDAACGLLVTDELDDASASELALPLSALIPLPRKPS